MTGITSGLFRFGYGIRNATTLSEIRKRQRRTTQDGDKAVAGIEVTPGSAHLADRRGTTRALQAWQAAYWSRDELPARDDLTAIDGADEDSAFFVAVDRESGAINRFAQRNGGEANPAIALAETVPAPILPHLSAAAQKACDTHRPVPCTGALPTDEGETLLWRSIFLPLSDQTEDSYIWLYAAFGCKRSADCDTATASNSRKEAS